MSSQPKADAPLAQKNSQYIVVSTTKREKTFLLSKGPKDSYGDSFRDSGCPVCITGTFHKVLCVRWFASVILTIKSSSSVQR